MRSSPPPTDASQAVLVHRSATSSDGRDACLAALGRGGGTPTNLLRLIAAEPPADWLRFWRAQGVEVANHRIVTVRPRDGLRGGPRASTTPKSRADLTEISVPGEPATVRVTTVSTDGQHGVEPLLTAVDEVLDAWAAHEARTVVCGGSLTALLDRSAFEQPARELQRLVDRLRRHGAHVHFHLDPDGIGADDRPDVAEVFDRVVDSPADHLPGPRSTPSTDVVFELLQDGSRRTVVRAVASADGELDVEELATRVAGPHRSEPGEPTGAGPHMEAKVQLIHAHLPKLDGAGVVEYDHDSGTVREGPHTDRISDVLTSMTE